MTGPRRRRRTTVSLFPFLSVLACIIGVLTLLITATAVGEIGSGAVDLETFERLEAEIARDRKQLDALRTLSDERAALEQALVAARSEEEALRARHAALGDVLDTSAPLREEIAEGERRVAALQADLERVAAERDGLEAKLREHREAVANAPLRLQPSGSGVGIDPHFAECRGDGIVLYEGAARRPLHVPEARIASSLDVRGFLRRVRTSRGASAILLMRPSGIRSCRALEGEAARHGARNGAMPIPEDGELDFSALGGRG